MKNEKERKLFPKLRFKEFEGEWQIKDFADIAKKKNVIYNPNIDKQVFRTIELESIESETGRLIKTFDSQELKSNKNYFDIGDVLFGKLRPYLKKYYLADFSGVCTSEIWVLKPSTQTDNGFLYQLIQGSRFISSSNVSSGSKMPRSDWDYVRSIKHSVPSLTEQQKIASFLTAVDKRIEQLTKKKKLLEEYKKGVMQKIFSQEIRFKIKNERGELVEPPEWEEKRLLKLADINKGTQKNADQLSQDGKYPVINGGKEPSGYLDEFNTEAETITISEGGNSCGYVNYLESLFWSGGHCYTLKINSNTHKKYLYHYLKHYETEIMKLRVGSGLPNIQKKDIESFEVQIPSPKEQAQIATFVDKIEQQYNVVDISTDQMTTFKQGLLQQMFI